VIRQIGTKKLHCRCGGLARTIYNPHQPPDGVLSDLLYSVQAVVCLAKRGILQKTVLSLAACMLLYPYPGTLEHGLGSQLAEKGVCWVLCGVGAATAGMEAGQPKALKSESNTAHHRIRGIHGPCSGCPAPVRCQGHCKEKLEQVTKKCKKGAERGTTANSFSSGPG
jgi:hypothetical protein